MSGDEDGSSVLGRVPTDVPFVAGYALLVGVLVLAGVVGGAVRVVLAAPLILFLPGYALLSVLFPADRPADAERPSVWRLPTADGLGWFERCSLAVPTSVALGPLVAVSLAAVGVPLTTLTVTTTLVALVLLASAAGAVRRIQLAPAARYDVPVGRWREELRTRWGGDGSRIDRGLDVLVALAVVLAVSGLAVGFAAPDTGESYTEAALLTQGNDRLVAGNYPEAVQAGQSTDLVLTLDNRLGVDAEYEVVVVLDRVRGANTTESLTVLERNELSRFSVSVADGQQAQQNLSVSPTLLGENLRLSVFVYRGEAPANPSGATADEHLYLWIDVR
ncbi:DUF1616 domain-containing protein [Halobaculum marinum]|uniref:DUF1616 domain-containing protein n=1 Tax=Halobaculum marinum TaxID=3031996 RepID=A0ABD5WZC7_9EURY|nr:DUF1616 domain-containing protein [Halobaculum sp. DT55]